MRPRAARRRWRRFNRAPSGRAALYQAALQAISRLALCEGHSHREMCTIVRDIHEMAEEALDGDRPGRPPPR
jgi:hypothetical protein